MDFKTYVLLDTMDSQAPIFQQVGNGQRIQLKKIPMWEPSLRQTYQDEDGESHTIRYKEASKFIDQSLQIKEEKLEANTTWTTSEREDRRFRHGVCITRKSSFIKYMDAHPANQKFKGYCDDYKTPCFKELDPKADTISENKEVRRRAMAAMRIFDIPLEEKQALLIKLFGSFYTVPVDPIECENRLIDILDEGDETIVNKILSNETSRDEQVSVLIGMLLSNGKLSFTEIPNQISLKKEGRWIDVKEISSEYTQDERKRYLLEFLTSAAGEALLSDMRNAMGKQAKVEKKVEARLQEEVKEEKREEVSLQSESELELAEKELSKAIEDKVHHLTIKKLQKRVDELKN